MQNKSLLQFISDIRLPVVPKETKASYRLHKFRSNIYRMLIVGSVLIIEQFLLAILFAESGSILQRIYFYSSLSLGLFVIAAVIFILKNPVKITNFHKLFEMSFVIFGMSAGLIRFIILGDGLTSLPTIYIAVLYGVAVIFVFSTRQGIFIYSSITVASVILVSTFNNMSISNLRADIITNGVIAWVVLFLNSHRSISSFLDKKKIELINSELREQSIRDGLTGLYNRRKLDEVFSEVCLKASRYDNDFAVIMLDIDYFKLVNDSRGHHVGDTVLIEFSRIIENNIREVDVCGRWGGEEFFVICQETELEYAHLLAERLREKIEIHSFSCDLNITASFGVASWEGCSDEDQLLKIVDSRLYEAKESGRNLVVAV